MKYIVPWVRIVKKYHTIYKPSRTYLTEILVYSSQTRGKNFSIPNEGSDFKSPVAVLAFSVFFSCNSWRLEKNALCDLNLLPVHYLLLLNRKYGETIVCIGGGGKHCGDRYRRDSKLRVESSKLVCARAPDNVICIHRVSSVKTELIGDINALR